MMEIKEDFEKERKKTHRERFEEMYVQKPCESNEVLMKDKSININTLEQQHKDFWNSCEGKEATIQFKKAKSTLIINEGLHFSFYRKQPNWFHRLMHKLFFGFRWENLE